MVSVSQYNAELSVELGRNPPSIRDLQLDVLS